MDKTADRPAWSPSTLAEVSEEYILTKFFSPSSEYLNPEPNLDIPVGLEPPKNPMRYSLPTEGDVQRYVIQDTPSSGGLAVTKDQVINHFEGKTHGKGGVREKVADILDRKSELEKGADAQNTWVRWRH